jgi:HlyD family secretion protein
MKHLRGFSTACVAATLISCTEPGPETMVGTLERDRIELKVESDEPITAIHVDDGIRVVAGTLVLSQEPGRHQARVQQKQALRDQAAARLAELRRGPRVEAIRESQARLKASEAITRDALADLERARDIFDRGLSNQAELDHALAAWQASSAREQAEREALEALLSGTTVEELQQAQAALDAAEAELALARLDLDRLQLRAPANGVVDKVLFEVGERPQPGSTVAVLLDSAGSYARIYVPEYLKAQVSAGTRLHVRLDGVQGTRSGIVRWISTEPSFTPYFALTEHDRSRLSYVAEVDLDDADSMPAGLPLEAWLPGAAEN